MQSYLNQHVAAAVDADRRRAARGRGQHRPPVARPPSGAARRSAASAVARLARRLDAEAARRATAA